MKDFINDNFFQITILAIIIAFATCLYVWADNAEKNCKKHIDNWLCKPIQEVYK